MDTRTINRIICNIMLQRGAIPPEEANTLLEGADHAYTCTCDTCREFWRIIGPDDQDGNYGPFGPTLDPPGEPTHD